MSTLNEAAAACCACLRVHWVEKQHEDGSTSGRWLCTQCGNDFVPAGALRFEAAKQAAFDQRYQNTVQANVRLVAENDRFRSRLARAEADIADLEIERGQVNAALRAEIDGNKALRLDLQQAARVAEQLAGEIDSRAGLPPMRWRAYNEPGTMFTREGELTADRQRSDAGRTMDEIHAEALRANE